MQGGLADHLADHQDRRAAQLEEGGVHLQVLQGRAALALVRQGGVLDHGHRCGQRETAVQQALLDFGQAGHAHVDHQRGTSGGQGCPVGRRVVLGMGGDQGHAAGHASQGQGDAAGGGTGQAGSDAVDDLAGDATGGQPFGFLAGTTEDAGIAALEPGHATALAGIAQHQPVDEGLGRGAAAAALADADHPGGRAVFEHRRIDQVIDHHHLGLAQGAHRLEGQQLGIAGAGTDQPDFPAHVVTSRFQGGDCNAKKRRPAASSWDAFVRRVFPRR